MLALALVTVFLPGCVTATRDVVVVRCGTVTPIDRETQRRAADEIDAQPAGSVLAEIIVPDWLRARDEARSCHAET